MYNISERIDTWQNKLAYYKRKESILKQRIANEESKRESINRLPVGSPKIERFYKYLNSLYAQYYALPSKIRLCRDNIFTLKNGI